MAIISPADLPLVMKMYTEPMKKYVLSKLGYPIVSVELEESQWETIWSVAGDFIAGYFPREQRLAVFWTDPLRSTYPLPTDAYWVESVSWDPLSTNVNDIFSAEAYLYNVGNTTSVQGLLLDYHLLQSYRKFSQQILGTQGHWEVINEVDGNATKQLIRLYPSPKGAFPVVVLYIPVIKTFRSPKAKQLAYDMMLAEAKIALGMARRKLAGIPLPDGGAFTMDGSDLVTEGEEKKKNIIEEAISLGEPMPIVVY